MSVLVLVRFAVIQSQYSALHTDILYALTGCLTFADVSFWNVPILAALFMLLLFELTAGFLMMSAVLLTAEKTRNPIVAISLSMVCLGAVLMMLPV